MIPLLLLCAAVFLVLVPWGGLVHDALLDRGIGKRIRIDGPASHQSKEGTATMGGLYFMAGIVAAALVLLIVGLRGVLLPVLAMAGFAALGAFDDLRGLRDSEGVGWLARHKFPAQWLVAIVLALALYWLRESHRLVIPVSGSTVQLGVWIIPLAAAILVAGANAVNLTDGLDGLAGGTAALAYGAYGVLALSMGQQGLALFCFAVVGALLAFLWYNVHPAAMFMGDVGSEALGAGLGMVALVSGHWLLLPVIGIIFVAEALSVMAQVSYFKWTRRRYGEGRRILRMAPLHHHYEQGGWSEVRITARFWIVAAIAAALGVALGGV
jgi:phospho-N-acetylmuramoyl-pentapeptide-transferase